VVDVDHRSGRVDASFRPNQILAVGGLPVALVEGERARRIVEAVERRLWTPLGLRSLAPEEPGYAARYAGGVRERDGAYHQGTVWPWLLGPFVEAWVRVRGNTAEARREARERFVVPLLAHLDEAGLGHVSEIADAEPPHAPRGCPFQAWSLGELLRLTERVLADPPAAERGARGVRA
jgi:glycogen debranching enzyme